MEKPSVIPKAFEYSIRKGFDIQLGLMCGAIICGCNTHMAEARNIGSFLDLDVKNFDRKDARMVLGMLDKIYECGRNI